MVKMHGDLFLSDDLNNYPGQQYTQLEKDIFGCFSDALPDRWGRTLLLRREQLTAMEEKRPVRRLSSFDFLTCIDDFSRIGAFRFKENQDREFINVNESLKIPPLTDIRELIAAKFPSHKDDYDTGLGEHFSHLLAIKAGINAAKTKVMVTGEKTLLSQRFDRTQNEQRIHFASAMTLLGFSDGDNVNFQQSRIEYFA